jgi:hypothetical protein
MVRHFASPVFQQNPRTGTIFAQRPRKKNTSRRTRINTHSERWFISSGIWRLVSTLERSWAPEKNNEKVADSNICISCWRFQLFPGHLFPGHLLANRSELLSWFIPRLPTRGIVSPKPWTNDCQKDIICISRHRDWCRQRFPIKSNRILWNLRGHIPVDLEPYCS